MRPVLRVGRNFFPAFHWVSVEPQYERIVERREDMGVIIVRLLWWYVVVGYTK